MKKNSPEQWKELVQFPNYEISTEGRMRRLLKTGIYKPLYPWFNKNVLFYQIQNAHRAAGRLVLDTYNKPAPNENHIVRYRNGNAEDVSLSNLYWEERSTIYKRPEPIKDIVEGQTYRVDLSSAEMAMLSMLRHEKKRRFGLTLIQHYEIILSDKTTDELAKKYGLTRQAICVIRQKIQKRTQFQARKRWPKKN